MNFKKSLLGPEMFIQTAMKVERLSLNFFFFLKQTWFSAQKTIVQLLI